MPATPIRVMCVEDNELVADAIGRKLSRDPRFAWLGSAHTFDGVMSMAATDSPHVICMDLDLPGVDTFALIRALRERHPDARVLMLTGHVREDLVNQAVDAGAWGFLSKAEESSVIVESLRRVAAGEFVLGKITQYEIGDGLHSGPVAPPPSPSPVQTRSWNPLHALFGGDGNSPG